MTDAELIVLRDFFCAQLRDNRQWMQESDLRDLDISNPHERKDLEERISILCNAMNMFAFLGLVSHLIAKVKGS